MEIHYTHALLGILCNSFHTWFQAMATPRELILKKVPFPMPTPTIFNLDQIEAFSTDTLVSENGAHHKLKDKNIFINFLAGYYFMPALIILTFYKSSSFNL